LKKNLFSFLAERRMAVVLFLGISSGLPFALSHGTLQAWFTDAGLSLRDIGWVGLAVFPYNFKFLWAPVMDRWVPPFLGRRRGWILICQLLLCITTASMVFFSPETHPNILFFIACLLAFFSASQDIVVDAYRTDVLNPEERALGGAMGVNGYRIAMLISGAFALIIADHWGWRICYLSMTALMAINTIATFLGPEPKAVATPKTFRDCAVLPFADFLKRPQAIWILLFIVFYKLGDAFAGSLNQTYLMREIHMTLSEIGTLGKFTGFFGTILGTTAGGLLVFKLGWFRSLVIFGVLQAVSNLAYMPLMWTGPNYLIAGFALLVENFCGGMAAAAFVGLLMNLCNARFSAFQYALFSSLSAVGVSFIKYPASIIAENYGWNTYFIASLALSLPGILLLFLLKDSIIRMIETKDHDSSKPEELYSFQLNKAQ